MALEKKYFYLFFSKFFRINVYRHK